MTKLPRSLLKPGLSTTWAIISFISCPTSLLAQPAQPTNHKSEQITIRFIPAHPNPPDRGTPPASEGTGSRGACLYKQQSPPLTSLAGSDRLKLTIKERPTFWVYVPYTPKEAPLGEFSLQDGDNDVYRTRFQLPATPGIVSITLPSTTKPLESGKEYRWYFDINCPSSVASAGGVPASVTGLVQRVAPSGNLERELNAATTTLERIATYARYGIWYETLTELAQLRLHEPQNPQIEDAWLGLLSDPTIGLERLARESISGSVITNSRSE